MRRYLGASRGVDRLGQGKQGTGRGGVDAALISWSILGGMRDNRDEKISVRVQIRMKMPTDGRRT